jgi:hypothetical protein
VAKTAAQTAVVLVLLDLLRLTRNADWFEEHGASSHLCVCTCGCHTICPQRHHASSPALRCPQSTS